jgi:hypothetical protein
MQFSGTYAFDKYLQSLNAELPISVTLSGIFISINAVF